MFYIYCFTNTVNQKKYIGSTTVDPQRRFSQHIYNATHEASPKYNYPLYCAMRLYGLDKFTYEVIEEIDCDELTLRQFEQDYIVKFNTLAPNGYNQTVNTEHPLNDPRTYEKMSNTKREKAKEIVELAEDNTIINKWRSIVDCAEATGLDEKKLGSCCRGERLATSNRRFCWINDDGTLDLKEYKRDPYKGAAGTTQVQSTSKKVAKINKNTDEIIAIYDTIALAARENNCDSSGISKVCSGRRNMCGGYKWQYVN